MEDILSKGVCQWVVASICRRTIGLIDDSHQKRQHHEQDKDFTQVFLAKAEIVIEVIALVFQGIERLILNLPPGASASHKMKDIVLGDGQIGNPGEMLRLAGLAVFFPVLDKGNPFILM